MGPILICVGFAVAFFNGVEMFRTRGIEERKNYERYLVIGGVVLIIGVLLTIFP